MHISPNLYIKFFYNINCTYEIHNYILKKYVKNFVHVPINPKKTIEAFCLYVNNINRN